MLLWSTSYVFIEDYENDDDVCHENDQDYYIYFYSYDSNNSNNNDNNNDDN